MVSLRSVSSILLLLFSAVAFAQESTDKLRSTSDKAQDLFDSGFAGSSPTDPVHVEEMPEYPGGQDALLQFISKETKYPAEALEQGITGKVLVQFIVEKSGKVDSVLIKGSVHPLLDAEALRVVGSLGDWVPGTQDGKSVPVKFILPISFTIPSGDLERIRKKAAKKAAKARK